MPTLYISEYAELPKDANEQVMPIPGAFVTEQTKAIGGTSAQSDAVNDSTRYVEVTADVDCHVAIGEDPTATTSSAPVWAKTVRPFSVKRGEKIAVIEAAS